MNSIVKLWPACLLTIVALIVVSSTLYGAGILSPRQSSYLPIVMSEGSEKTAIPSLKRGINLAGDFEVEPRDAWGTRIEAHFFDLAVEAGFDHVRVPIRWSAHTAAAPDFTIDAAFFAEVDWLLDQAERVGLSIVIDNHHFEELDADPLGNRDELLAIWQQIGSRYAQRAATVVFELNNEPTGAFTTDPELWNQLLADTLAVVRNTNETRLVIIGPVQFNHPNQLSTLRLPDDPNLMATIHVYDPTDFTAQGAVWFDPIPPTGVVWRNEQPTFDIAWNDASWDSVVTRTDEGFTVAFERQYAAFGAIRPAGAVGTFDTLTVEADQAFEAVVLCNWETNLTISDFSTPVPIAGSGVEMTANIASCGSLEAVAIQLVSETLLSPTLRRLDMCAAGATSLDECERVIVRSDEAHERVMRRAATWSAENSIPLYLGEFGVYDDPTVPVDRASRAAWIRSLRVSAENHNINWAFFELSNEFGVYDHNAQTWHDDILDALFRTGR